MPGGFLTDSTADSVPFSRLLPFLPLFHLPTLPLPSWCSKRKSMHTQNGLSEARTQQPGQGNSRKLRKAIWGLKAITNRWLVVVLCYSENELPSIFYASSHVASQTLEKRTLNTVSIVCQPRCNTVNITDRKSSSLKPASADIPFPSCAT